MDIRVVLALMVAPLMAAAAGAKPTVPTVPAAPDANLFAQQWALENKGQSVCRFDGANCIVGKAGADIKAKQAWAKVQDCSGVIVAVLDTGVDTRHADLAGNLLAGKNFVGSWETNDPTDDNLHGTHVTGIIAGAGTETRGVSGVCRRAKVLPVKVGSADGYLTDADVLEGIAYAVKQKAKVVNGSFGGGPANELIRLAVKNASGTLFIFAAGNGDDTGKGYDIDKKAMYPASYALPNIVAVAATDGQDRLGRFSNFGARSVHLAAPGVNIMSTMPSVATKEMVAAGMKAGYGSIDGTSMATPYVAGAAALYWASAPKATVAEVKGRLLASVDKVSALEGKVQSGGRLNLAKLVGVK